MRVPDFYVRTQAAIDRLQSERAHINRLRAQNKRQNLRSGEVSQTVYDAENKPHIDKDSSIIDHHLFSTTKTIMQKRSGTDVSVLLEPTIERLRLNLAQYVLLGIAIFFVLGGSAKLFAKDGKNGDEIFEACKTIFPPIGTLVIGYYFGEREK
jgi:hypothetical protein